MYIAKSTSKSKSGKVYESTLLRESYRENGKVKNRTLANLSNSSEAEIAAIRLALKYKDSLHLLSKDFFLKHLRTPEITKECSIGIEIKMITEPSEQTVNISKTLNIKLPKTIEEVKVPVVTRNKTKKPA